jgi:cation diffusion facilitator CzcD-associated flavoprotein CzcO
MGQQSDLLIVGAGPFGLSLAAHASDLGMDYRLVGEPMGFWTRNMPAGMLLRSDCSWHLDTAGIHTMDVYLARQGCRPADVEPLSLDFYLGYVDWFRRQKALAPEPLHVAAIDVLPDGTFEARLADGSHISARSVALALGFSSFPHVPEDLSSVLPEGGYTHTCDAVDLAAQAGKRCLIVGGRQSAFEWAALLAEAGAASVHVAHRHDSPAFAASDWSWVGPLVDAMIENPSWFRDLSPAEQQVYSKRLWNEGRAKVEPWLERRIRRPEISVLPNTRLMSCERLEDGSLRADLDDGRSLDVDQIILATGYKVDMGRIPMLAAGNLSGRLAVRNGFPELDPYFQSSVPGLFVTSMPAAQDFGPFFGFTISVRTSAQLIGQGVSRHLERSSPPA